jgi:hypothetical protein
VYLTETLQLKSVKIIKDRDDKPKGFGYVEFTDIEGLKHGLAKSGNASIGFFSHAKKLSITNL